MKNLNEYYDSFKDGLKTFKERIEQESEETYYKIRHSTLRNWLVGFCFQAPTGLIWTYAARRISMMSLSLDATVSFVALCQAISLGVPITQKSIPVHPRHLP